MSITKLQAFDGPCKPVRYLVVPGHRSLRPADMGKMVDQKSQSFQKSSYMDFFKVNGAAFRGVS